MVRTSVPPRLARYLATRHVEAEAQSCDQKGLEYFRSAKCAPIGGTANGALWEPAA